MKKLRILSLILALVMAVALFVGCVDLGDQEESKGKNTETSTVSSEKEEEKVPELTDEEKIIGTWAFTFEMDNYINYLLSSEEDVEFFEVEGMELQMNFIFFDNGTYKMAADEDSTEKFISDFLVQFRNAMELYMMEVLKQEGIEMSLDEFLTASGTSMDELMEEAFSDVDLESVVNESMSQGLFKLENGKIYLSDDLEGDFSEDEGSDYKFIDDDTLEVSTELEGDDEEDEELKDILAQMTPMTLKRVK